jgi:hypothetical protein
MREIRASLDAALRSGSGRIEAARSISIRVLELAPEATRHEVFRDYTACLEKHANVQVTAKFSGTVSYSDGTAIPNAVVRVEGYGLSDATNDQGRFELTLPAGSGDSLSVIILLDDRREQLRLPLRENVPVRLQWTSPPLDDLSLPVGESTFVDLSERQREWINLTAWLSASGLAIGTLDRPFAANNPHASRARVLILPIPFHTAMPPGRIAAIRSWVERGGGLLYLGHYAADVHHGVNSSDLISGWGLNFEQVVLLPPDVRTCSRQHVYGWDDHFVLRVPVPLAAQHPIFAGVSSVALMSSGSLRITSSIVKMDAMLETPANTNICRAKPITCSPNGLDCTIDWEPQGTAAVPVLVAFKQGAGRVVIAGTWKMLNPTAADNAVLIRNILTWLRGGS